jgi:hypothetical protein
MDPPSFSISPKSTFNLFLDENKPFNLHKLIEARFPHKRSYVKAQVLLDESVDA